MIQRIKTLVEDVIEKRREEQMQPMSLDEFYAKIDESEKAYERGEFTTQDELREEINTWRKT
ncbi:MAG: hypothetical protein GY940_41440 [bacterium]|nr:hypothetical protein [bacterium]